jgi:hypothetical protein
LKSHIARILIGTALIVSIALMPPVSAQAPATVAPAESASRPSKLDYLVLASLADSSNMLAMSAYRAP